MTMWGVGRVRNVRVSTSSHVITDMCKHTHVRTWTCNFYSAWDLDDDDINVAWLDGPEDTKDLIAFTLGVCAVTHVVSHVVFVAGCLSAAVAVGQFREPACKESD